jgi:DNA-binding CsgD family transcriptional regulator
MTKQIIWTKRVLEAFIDEGNLNKRQEFIIRTRAEGYSILRQAEELHLSVDQVNKEIAHLRRIYDATQVYSNVLPPRCKNKADLNKIL